MSSSEKLRKMNSERRVVKLKMKEFIQLFNKGLEETERSLLEFQKRAEDQDKRFESYRKEISEWDKRVRLIQKR